MLERVSGSFCRVLPGALVVALAGCADKGPSGPSDNSSFPLIMDQLHNGGTEGFLFLPPIVPPPAKLGDIVEDLPVTVVVDELDDKGGTLRRRRRERAASRTGASSARARPIPPSRSRRCPSRT